MSTRCMLAGAATLVALAAAASNTQAAFFSFASDGNSSGFTVLGTAGANNSFNITAQLPHNNFKLQIDDNNGPLPTVEVLGSQMTMNFTATPASSSAVAGTLFRHTYTISGSFSFRDSSGILLLTGTVETPTQGLMTVMGARTSWSSVGSLLGDDTYAVVTYSWTPALINLLGGPAVAAQYGLVGSNSVGPDDFGFTLSVLNNGTLGSAVSLVDPNKLPSTNWQAEGSFSGSTFVPTPGAAALLGAAGLFTARRRRN